MMEWISINEKICDFGKQVLTFDGLEITIGWQCGRDPIEFCDITGSLYKATHWMPLPDKPKYKDKS